MASMGIYRLCIGCLYVICRLLIAYLQFIYRYRRRPPCLRRTRTGWALPSPTTPRSYRSFIDCLWVIYRIFNLNLQVFNDLQVINRLFLSYLQIIHESFCGLFTGWWRIDRQHGLSGHLYAIYRLFIRQLQIIYRLFIDTDDGRLACAVGEAVGHSLHRRRHGGHVDDRSSASLETEQQ